MTAARKPATRKKVPETTAGDAVDKFIAEVGPKEEAAPEEEIVLTPVQFIAVFVVNGVNVATIPVDLQSTQGRALAVARRALHDVADTAEVEFYTLDPEA